MQAEVRARWSTLFLVIDQNMVSTTFFTFLPIYYVPYTAALARQKQDEVATNETTHFSTSTTLR